MGLQHSPKTVTNGLILAIDASNLKSYPGSGTTWYDLSGNSNHLTIYGSPSLINTNSGYFNFDGIDDAMMTSTTLPAIGGLYADVAYQWSVSCWFKFPTNPVDRGAGNVANCILGVAGGVAGGATFALYVGSISNDGYNGSIANALMFVMRGAPTRISPGLVNDNAWHNFCVAWNGSVAALYYEGVYIGNAINNVSAGYQGNLITVGNNANNTAGYQMYQGGINNILIYNRALSATEALQNYNSTKSRFGY